MSDGVVEFWLRVATTIAVCFVVWFLWVVVTEDDEDVARRQASRTKNLEREAVEITLSDGTVCVWAYSQLACGQRGGAK